MKDLLVPLILVLMLCIDRHYHVCPRERLERIEAYQALLEKSIGMTHDEVWNARIQVQTEFGSLSDHFKKKLDGTPTISTAAPTQPQGVTLAAGALTLSPEVHWETLDEILSRRRKK